MTHSMAGLRGLNLESQVYNQMAKSTVFAVWYQGSPSEVQYRIMPTRKDNLSTSTPAVIPQAEDAPGSGRPGPWYVERPEAQAKLGRGIAGYPVVLIVAPNGSGKSALVARVLDRSGDAGGRGVGESGAARLAGPAPIAWVDVTARTSSPQRFSAALLRALAEAEPALRQAVQGLKPIDEQGAFAEEDASQLVDAITRLAPSLHLVIDGYEHVTSSSADTLTDYLLSYLPDTTRVIIATAQRSSGNHSSGGNRSVSGLKS